MDKCFATWISCTLLKILSISISLSQVAASYYFLDSSLSCVLCLSCSFWSTYVHGLFWTTLYLILGQKGGDILHLTCSCDHDIVFCALDIWYVDHDHFVLYLWILDMVILTHEWILTIFRQMIFVDICGYLCVNLFKSCGSALEYV